jgi:hypothetical protein
VSGLTLFGFLGWVARFVESNPQLTWAPFALTCVQLLVILSLLFIIPRAALAPEGPLKQRVDLAVERIELFWRLAWLIWAIEYLVLAGHELYHQYFPNPHVGVHLFTGGDAASLSALDIAIHVILNCLNNLSSLFIFLCAWMMAEETFKDGRHRPPWSIGVFLVVAISTLDLLFFLGYVFYPAFLSGAVWARGWYFEIFSGFIAGTTMAMLVGKLDTKVIGLPRWVLLTLYAYASLQVTWAMFEFDYLRPFALALALIGKVLLFAIMYWLLKYGIMAYYGTKLIKIMEESPRDRKVWTPLT